MSCVPQTILSASSIALLNNARASLTKTRILFNITVLSAPTTTEKIMCIFFSCTFTTLTRIGTGSAKSNPRGALRYRALYSRRRHRTHTVRRTTRNTLQCPAHRQLCSINSTWSGSTRGNFAHFFYENGRKRGCLRV